MYETLLGVRAKCYVCGTCSASTYGLTSERATEATAGSMSSRSEACIVSATTWLLQAVEKIKHDVLTKSKQLTCTARMHCYWPLPELQRGCASSRMIPSHLLMTCTARDAVGRSWPPAWQGG